MPLLSILQSQLTGGELSPFMAARVDLQRYQNSVALMRNFIVRQWGGADNRPGTDYIGTTKNSANGQGARIIPFIFNNSQSYCLEFGQNYIRFITNGAYIQQSLVNCPNYSSTATYFPGQWVNVSGVLYYCIQMGTNHAPASSPAYWTQQTVYEVYSPYNFSDLVLLKWTQSADVLTLTHQGYAQQELSRYADNVWTLAPYSFTAGPFQPANANTGITVYANATTGSVTITASSPIFNANHVGTLFKIAEQNLQGIPPWEPNKQIATGTNSPFGLLRRSNGNVYKCITTGSPGAGNPEWRTGTLAPTWTSGAEMDGDGNPITSGGASPTVYASKAGMLWQYVHSQYGIAIITAYTDTQHVTATVITYIPDSCVSSGPTLVTEVNVNNPGTNVSTFVFTGADAPTNDTNKANYTAVASYNNGTQFTYPQQTFSIDATGAHITFITPPGENGNCTNITVTHSSSGVTNSSYVYSFGSWSTEFGFPSCCAYMGDRLCFGGSPTEPQTVWMSGVSDYVFFGESNPIIDSDSIDITVNSRKINTIEDLVPLSNLMILTTGAEFALFGDSSGLIAPSSVNIKGQSYHGITSLKAHAIGNSAVFVQARGYIVRDMTYSFQENAYVGMDLTQYASHLTLGYTLVDSDYAELPYSVMWFVRNDGELLSMTYMRDQQILGWARHDTTNGLFQNVCVVPEGNEDVPYFVIQRQINGQTVYYVERLHTRQFDDIQEAVFLDASLSYDGTNYTATNLMTLTGGVNWDSEENLTLTASGAGNTPFSAVNVGCDVNLTGADGSVGRVTVIGYTSSTVVTVRPINDVPPSLQGVATNVYGIGFVTYNGLNHLVGQEVNVLADGRVFGPYTVSNGGSITIEQSAVIVCAGLPITAQIETLEIVYPYGETVSGKSMHGIYKQIPRVTLLVDNSRPFSVGTNFEGNLYDTKMRWQEPMDEATQPFTGPIQVDTESTSDLSMSVCIQVDNPVPVTILGIIPEVAPGQ